MKIYYILLSGLIALPAWSDISPPAESSKLALPHSNQIQFEAIDSYVYLGFEKAQFLNSSISLSHFTLTSRPSESNRIMYSLISEHKLADLHQASLWFNYQVGLLNQAYQLTDDTHHQALDSETSTVLIVPVQLGIKGQWNWSHHLIPHVGLSAGEYFYRMSSSLSSAESQGNLYCWGPSLGLRWNPSFSQWLSLMAEWSHHQFPKQTNGFSSADSLTSSIGWYF